MAFLYLLGFFAYLFVFCVALDKMCDFCCEFADEWWGGEPLWVCSFIFLLVSPPTLFYSIFIAGRS